MSAADAGHADPDLVAAGSFGADVMGARKSCQGRREKGDIFKSNDPIALAIFARLRSRSPRITLFAIHLPTYLASGPESTRSGHGPTSRQGGRTATAISATSGHEPGVGIAAESAGGGWTHGRASVEVWVALFAFSSPLTDRRTLLTATRRGFQARASGSKVTIDVGNPACSRFDGTRPAPCDFILTRLPHADSFFFRVITLPRCRSKHVGSFPRRLSARCPADLGGALRSATVWIRPSARGACGSTCEKAP